MPSASPASLPARLESSSVAAHVKNLNGTKGRGAYSIRVKHDMEYNELALTLADGHAARDTYYIDLGHTKADKLAALDDLYATAARMLAL